MAGIPSKLNSKIRSDAKKFWSLQHNSPSAREKSKNELRGIRRNLIRIKPLVQQEIENLLLSREVHGGDKVVGSVNRLFTGSKQEKIEAMNFLSKERFEFCYGIFSEFLKSPDKDLRLQSVLSLGNLNLKRPSPAFNLKKSLLLIFENKGFKLVSPTTSLLAEKAYNTSTSPSETSANFIEP